MTKPLTLNISKIPQLQGFKQNHIISASELLSKYMIKSPINSRICLTDRTHSANKNINSPRNTGNLTSRKSLKHLQLSCKVQKEDIPFLTESKPKTSTFSKIKSIDLQEFKINKQMIHQPLKSIKKGQYQKTISNELRLPLKLIKDTDKIVNRSNVTKLLRQMIKKKNKYQNKQKYPKQATLKRNIFQQNKALTERHSQKINLNANHKRTGTFRHHITSQSEEQCFSLFSPRDAQTQNVFRKGSSASTLSLKTKHTISMQHLDDYQQLFPKESIDSRPSSIRQSQKINTIQNLQKVKQKIYEKLYSLDKKLIKSEIPEKIKKPIVISLKRKKQVLLQEYQAQRSKQ